MEILNHIDMPDGGICIEWRNEVTTSHVFTRQDLENYFETIQTENITLGNEVKSDDYTPDFDTMRDELDMIDLINWYNKK